MIPLEAYRGKRIGVFGLARTGRAAVAALVASGAEVLAWDDSLSRRAEAGARAVDLHGIDLASLDALMLAPGVPLTHPAPHPLVGKARAAGVPLVGDIEMFAQARADLPAHDLVAITGTNGKSTTTALVAHMLADCGRPAASGGNIGLPVLALDPLPAGGVYVFELSSYQIDLTQSLDPGIAILLNISPDHLDRHGDLAGYIAAKRRLFAMQQPPHVAIIGVDDAPGRAIAASLRQPVIEVSVRRVLARGVFVSAAGMLVDARDGTAREIGGLSGLATLRGRHNWQNAAAAWAAGRVLGLDDAAILAAFATFPGLAHRCERVAVHKDVTFINDSKATNIEAAATALAAFDRIRWIAGGRAKTTDLGPLEPFFARIRSAFLIGEAAGAFARELGDKVPHRICDTLGRAVAQAIDEAEPGDTILFSPACASFDQFTDFEARGEAFRHEVRRGTGA